MSVILFAWFESFLLRLYDEDFLIHGLAVFYGKDFGRAKLRRDVFGADTLLSFSAE